MPHDNFHIRQVIGEDDFWQARFFLRQGFLQLDSEDTNWHVARFDYWRWHLINTCGVCTSMPEGLAIWEDRDGQITALIYAMGNGEVRLHIDPRLYFPAVAGRVLVHAEAVFAAPSNEGGKVIYLPVRRTDKAIAESLQQLGYAQWSGVSHQCAQDLDESLELPCIPDGYAISSMGTGDEYAARSWASWRAFHSDEPDSAYDGDSGWYANIQNSPLYRRDLDLVAKASDGSIAAFCVISYDDATRSAVAVQVGTAAEHWRKGLGKALLLEGMQRLHRLGCKRIFATGYDKPAQALYESVMQHVQLADTWGKLLPGDPKSAP